MLRYLACCCLLLVSFSAASYSVSGGRILDDQGRVVQLRGVNWFGFETTNYTPHGLWARNWKEMIQQMKGQGFNAVRLPLCPSTLRGVAPNSIDYSRNADLNGLNSLQLLDKVVAEFSAQGFYILLDHHRPDCNAISELWYTSQYPESQWIADLKFLAQRYSTVSGVIGIDLKNEPHGAATWGRNNASTDWNLAAERAASAVLPLAPRWLIFVEGIQENASCQQGNGHFWGENLEPMACKPLTIQPDRLVLSPHTYGPDVYGQPYFSDPAFPNNMPAIWERNFGQFKTQGHAVVLGEFGGKYGEGDSRDKAWQDALVTWLIGKGMSSSFYWSWNPNSGDTGGVLRDDWTTVRQDKMTLLRRLWGTAPPTTPPPGNPPPTTPPPSNPPPTTTTTVPAQQSISSDWGAGYCANVRVSNTSSKSILWATQAEIGGRIDNLWNATGSATTGKVTFKGVEHNRVLAPGQSAEFGYCATRSTPPAAPPPPAQPSMQLTITKDSDWGAGYCQRVGVKNTGSAPLDWTVSLKIEGKVNNLWSAEWKQSGNLLTAGGLSWNNVLAAGASTEFGFCAAR